MMIFKLRKSELVEDFTVLHLPLSLFILVHGHVFSLVFEKAREGCKLRADFGHLHAGRAHVLRLHFDLVFAPLRLRDVQNSHFSLIARVLASVRVAVVDNSSRPWQLCLLADRPISELLLVVELL